MKHWAVVLGVLLIGASASRAAPERFPISLRGTVATDTGSTPLTDQDLVTVAGNRLVLMIDVAGGVVAIEEWNATLTSQVDRDAVLSGKQSLMENFRMATIAGRSPQFMANLEMVDTDWDHDGVDDTDGNLQIVAKLTRDRTTGRTTRISAQLMGVLNDPVNGAGSSTAKVFKGTLRTTGPAF